MRQFNGIPTQNYIGIPRSQSTQLGTRADQPPQVVALTIFWNNYLNLFAPLPQFGVVINLTGGTGPKKTMDAIRSVYIDNTNSFAPVYLYFPSTQMTITCGAGQTNWSPVHSEDLVCILYGENFVANDLPITQVFLSNVVIPPFTNNEVQLVFNQLLQSPGVPVSDPTVNSPGFGVPAAGDRYSEGNMLLDGSINFTPIIPGNPAGGTNIITNFQANVHGVLSSSATDGLGQCSLAIASGGGTIFKWFWFQPKSSGIQVQNFTALLFSGIQYPVDATRDLVLDFLTIGTPSSGWVSAEVQYTYVS